MKGQKTGGRTKGTQNKVTQDIRQSFKLLVEGNFKEVQGWLNKVAKTDPAEALKLYMALSERVLPKLSSQSVDMTSDGYRLQSPVIVLNGNITESD